MKWNLRALAVTTSLLIALFAIETAFAQKQGGILKMYNPDSPASMSIHEEATVFAEGPMMGVFNNLVMFDQHMPQNSLQSIVPDLATGWAWSEEGTELTLPLHEGFTRHDGKPFTARDVACTFDLLTGKSSENLRVNPRKSWYRNLERIATKGDYEVTFHLKQPQPAFLTALASGFSPIYPCHVPPRDMRQHPIGTGPFKIRRVQFDMAFPYSLTVPLLPGNQRQNRRRQVLDDRILDAVEIRPALLRVIWVSRYLDILVWLRRAAAISI
jgi:peptide/nickel transport system substrate-binding protein